MGVADPKAKRLNPIKRQQMEDRLHEIEKEIARAEAAIALCESQLQSFVSAEETQRQTQELAQRKSEVQSLMKEWEELSGDARNCGLAGWAIQIATCDPPLRQASHRQLNFPRQFANLIGTQGSQSLPRLVEKDFTYRRNILCLRYRPFSQPGLPWFQNDMGWYLALVNGRAQRHHQHGVSARMIVSCVD